MLLAPNRYFGDAGATADLYDRALRRFRIYTTSWLTLGGPFRNRARCRGAATLEPRHIGAGDECRIAVERLRRDVQRQLSIRLWITARRNIDLTGGDGALEFGCVVGDRAQAERQLAKFFYRFY